MKAPSVHDAILDFNTQLEIITKEISIEYTRMFNADELGESGMKGASPRGKAHASTGTATAYTSPA